MQNGYLYFGEPNIYNASLVSLNRMLFNKFWKRTSVYSEELLSFHICTHMLTTTQAKNNFVCFYMCICLPMCL